LFSLAFSAQETFAQSKKKKADKEKWKSKGADAKKNQKPYKKVIDSTAVTQRD
jgi:hypothetical protein